MAYQVEIIPLTLLPLHRSPLFTYKYSEPLPYGTLVSIPFGSQTIQGITTTSKQQHRFPAYIKAVLKVEELSVVTKEQVELCQQISEATFTPLGKTLRHTLPKQAKRLLKEENALPTKKHLPLKTSVLVTRFLQLAKPALYLNRTSQDVFLWQVVKKLVSQQQVLLLAPEILQLYQLEAEALKYFEAKNIVIIHSHLTSREYKTNWQKIRNNEARIIIATRQGLFAPFHSLGAIILTNEQDQGYKQWDMSPRYNGRTVALALAQLHRAKLLMITGTPSLESLVAIQNKELILLNQFSHKPVLEKTEIINLRLERYRKNFSPLSEALRETLKATLAAQKQVVLIVPTRGIAQYSVCSHCKKIFRCPKTGHPLREERGGHYQCPGCEYHSGLFPSCPSCGHLGFWQRGLGTEKIALELKRLFPSATIARFDGETIRQHTEVLSNAQKALRGEIDILIGTHMLEKIPALHHLGLIAMIDADNALAGLDFRSDERFLQSMAQLSIGAQASEAIILIQTFEPEHHFFRSLTHQSYEQIATTLLADRELLKYPPLSLTYSLTYVRDLSPKNRTKAESLLQNLNRDFPHLQLTEKTKKTPTRKVTADILLRQHLPLPSDFPQRLKELSPYFTIDPNPLHFF